MILERELTVGVGNFLFRGGLLDPQHLVIVAFCGHRRHGHLGLFPALPISLYRAIYSEYATWTATPCGFSQGPKKSGDKSPHSKRRFAAGNAIVSLPRSGAS